MTQHIMAHRGASGYAPENTLEAFDLAVKMGAYGVELDAQLTRDGEIVVAHDETIDRVSEGSGYIADMTLSELKKLRFNKTFPEYKNATIPTLREVFELLGPAGLYVNVELKNSLIDYEGLERKVIELASSMGVLDHVLFSSFNHYSLLRVKEIDSSLYCGLLYEATPVRAWEYAARLCMDALHPQFASLLVPGDLCEKAHEAGLQVNPWTVNSEDDLRAVIKKGADHIISNYPDKALELLAEAK